MFNNTRKIFNQTKRDIDLVSTLFQFGTQAVFVLYQIYLVFTSAKIWYLHLALLIISITYFVYDIVATKGLNKIKRKKVSIFDKKRKKQEIRTIKHKKGTIKRVKKYTEHIINLFVLACAFYPIIVTPQTVHPLSVMATTFMVILWIVNTAFELIKQIIFRRIDMFSEALSDDFKFVTAPMETIKDKFSRFTSKDASNNEPDVQEDPTVPETQQSGRVGVAKWLSNLIKGRKGIKNQDPNIEDDIDLTEDEKV